VNRKDVTSGLLVYPDPVTGPGALSGATFLYFQRSLFMTSPPLVITEKSYDLWPLVEERCPDWSDTFFMLVYAWQQQLDGWREMLNILDPLKERCFKVVYLSYPANSAALQDSGDLAASTGLSIDSIGELINPANACGEIIRHIMLEAFLEVGEDIEALFDYCGEFFAHEALPHLLAKGYLLRSPMLAKATGMPVLLTNERFMKLLSNLPVETTAEVDRAIDDDIIAWELFRQILSPHVDPLDAKRVELIAKLLDSRTQEIQRLRLKCYALAEQVRQPSTLEELPAQIERFVKMYVEREIADLLELDQRALEEFFTALFADEKTWLAVCTFIASLVIGQVHVTAGAAIAALSSIGAKAFKAAADRRKKLRQSDYALVYTIARQR